jgi:hypothetical protein
MKVEAYGRRDLSPKLFFNAGRTVEDLLSKDEHRTFRIG